MELLLADKANVNAKNNDGATPLHLAVMAMEGLRGQVASALIAPVLSRTSEVVELLRQHGSHE